MRLYHCYYSSGLGPGQLRQPAVETVLSLSTCRIIKHTICMLQVILNEKKCTRLKDNLHFGGNVILSMSYCSVDNVEIENKYQ